MGFKKTQAWFFFFSFTIILVKNSFSETTSSNIEKKINNPLIRVLLINSVSSFDIMTHDSWNVKMPGGKSLLNMDKGSSATISLKDKNVILKTGGNFYHEKIFVLESTLPHGILEIKKVPYGVGWWWAGTQDRTYEGCFEIRPLEKGVLEVVLILPMEDYLLGVVPSEIGANSPKEALCAQAVAARSEALMALSTGKYAGTHHDIGSDVESQAFTGKTKCTPESNEAVKATRGFALIHNSKPIAAYYASSCGGHTDDIRNVWPHRAGEKAYWDIASFDGEKSFERDLTKEADLKKWLEDNPDVYCNPQKHQVPEWASKNFRWEREITTQELTKRVVLNKDIGRITGIKAIRRGPSGRMIEAEFTGEKGTWKIGPELAIRQVFDPPLKSAAFVVDAQGPEKSPDKFILRGAGWGHGIGMCQTGAIAMANEGKAFREILLHYYPSSKIEAIYP